MPIPRTAVAQPRALLRDNVYLSLRDAIVDGTLAPGERLRDTEIESWLGVSRTPIREALLRLERAGLVVTRPGRSTTVAPFDAASTVNAQQIAASMHELAARLGVPRLTDADLAAMEHANAAFAAAIHDADTEAALREDDRFHAVLIVTAGNPLIAEVLETVTPVLRRVERMRFGSVAARDSVSQHDAIMEAARTGDADRAASFSRENWLSLSYAVD